MEGGSNELKQVHKSMGRPKKNLEAEERAKREIANSNERRRMQSINNGFSCLRQILRQHNNIDKHSKAAVLHQSARYIKKLEQDINHFTEQNQMLKNFIDNYRKQRDNQQKNVREESMEERVDGEGGDIEEISAYVPPNKKARTSEDVSVNPSTGDSHGSGNHSLNDRSVLQSPQELTQLLEKEVNQLKSLLERERQMRTGLEIGQQNIGFRFEANSFTPIMRFPINGFLNNQIPNTSSLPTPLTAGYHMNCEDRPLNLKTNKHSFNGFPMSAIQDYKYRFVHPYKTSLNFSPKCNSRLISSTNVYRPDVELNRQENQTQVNTENYKNTHQNPLSLQLMPVPIEQNQALPLPLIKKPKELMHSMSSTTFDGHDLSIDTTPPISPSMSGLNPGFKENLDIILKAIQHIEGKEVMKSGDPSTYVRQLAEKFNIKSVSVLKHILSEDYRNNNKSKPTVHSVDSLL